jgi:hypothetical protein
MPRADSTYPLPSDGPNAVLKEDGIDSGSPSTATIGFEAKLWLTADKLRNNMDAAEPSGARQTATGSPKGERGGANQYKHVVFGFIFLKYGVKLGGISTYVHGKLSHIAALAA